VTAAIAKVFFDATDVRMTHPLSNASACAALRAADGI